MTTFEDKLKEAMGEKGYGYQMRRSIQTVILYEANRIIKPKLPPLRPFQRKLAFTDQAKTLIAELDCIPSMTRQVFFGEPGRHKKTWILIQRGNE